ncbi:hypothetical protein EHS39_14675 [Ensifer sp. MPMI2T]|nr:hypothetical protein EHS39_14675 [Ensifer sp. MPMI2T]
MQLIFRWPIALLDADLNIQSRHGCNEPPLDHDDFGSIRPKIINVIDSNKKERDAGGKPHTLFLIPLYSVIRKVETGFRANHAMNRD